jgi:putative transposase
MKCRKSFLLDTEIISFLKTICFEIGERYCFEFDAIGTDGDHVHLFVGVEPKYSPSRVIQIIKSITARKIFKEFPEIKNSYRGVKCGVIGIYWNRGRWNNL